MSEVVIENQSFKALGLDQRLLKAIQELRWTEPTAIQCAVIPYVLEGRNVVTRARTGCGKTAAYALPIIQRLLHSKQVVLEQMTSVLILCPSSELCVQTDLAFKQMSAHCNDVTILNVGTRKDIDVIRPLLSSGPDVVIGTPSRILSYVQSNIIPLRDIRTIVVDEADLVLGFGFDEDIMKFGRLLHASENVMTEERPSNLQVVLVSATLSDDVKPLRRCLQPPKTDWIRVELPDEPFLPSTTQLAQYVILAEEHDKFLLLLALFKLRLVQGKTILFISTVDRCYRVKLFMEEFAIRAVVLNSLLPANSRAHAIHEFNNGRFDVLLVADELGKRRVPKHQSVDSRTRREDEASSEFDVSRGIDFHLVSNVINFDFPPSPKAYIHRVGRTARGNQRGSALSFVRMNDQSALEAVKLYLQQHSNQTTEIMQPFHFRMEEVDQLRYRCNDALRKISKRAVHNARLTEIRQELLNSEQLKHLFSEKRMNPLLLTHVKKVSKLRPQAHMAHLPDYLVPNALKNQSQGKSKGKFSHGSSGGLSALSQDVKKSKFNRMKKKKDPLRRI